jgi:hypothetical protein
MIVAMVVANKDNSIKINKDEYSFGDQITRHPNGTLPVLKNGEEFRCKTINQKHEYNYVRACKIVVKKENGQNKIYFITEKKPDAENPWCIITDSKDLMDDKKCKLKQKKHKHWNNFYLFHYKDKNDLPIEFM